MRRAFEPSRPSLSAHRMLGRIASVALCAVGWAVPCTPGAHAQALFSVFIEAPAPVIPGPFFDVVKTNRVRLFGTNSIPGAHRVTVNGAEASFDPETGHWSAEPVLSAGFRRLWFEVIDAAGVPRHATNRNLLVELEVTHVGGTLEPQTTWTPDAGVIYVTNTLVVPEGGSLAVEPGCVIRFAPEAAIVATNAGLRIQGQPGQPVHCLPAAGTNVWDGLQVSGTNGILTAQHLELIAGRVALYDGASGTLEDAFLHDYEVSSPPILYTLGVPEPVNLTVRRCHFARYFEILSRRATNLIEDSLFEHTVSGGDGTDFDAGLPGSVVRRCTYRHGNRTNMDALDLGEYGLTREPSRGVRIEDCLIHDYVDKGISMGVGVEVTVSNCLIYAVDSGIAVKDDSLAGVVQCTIVDNHHGFNNYNKALPTAETGGGHITNSYHNILWHNLEAVTLLNGSTLIADHSVLEDTPWPGDGILDVDPRFVDAAERDYRLAADSPLRTAGRDGAGLGADFPVGAPMAPSHPSFTRCLTDTNAFRLRFWVDSDKSYSVLASDNAPAGPWTAIAHFLPGPEPREVEATVPIDTGPRFFKIATPIQP